MNPAGEKSSDFNMFQWRLLSIALQAWLKVLTKVLNT